VAEPKQTLLGTTELFSTGDFDIQFFLLLLGAVRPPNGMEGGSVLAFGGERKRNELIAVCTCGHEERGRGVALSSLPEQFLE